jgi:hypothetical protein
VTFRPVFRDPDLPHQIVLWLPSGNSAIAMSCNCRASRNGNGSVHHDPIEERTAWEPGEAVAAWRKHLPAAEAVA